MIINGLETSKIMRVELKNKANQIAEKLHRPCGLAVVLVGADPASQIYVRNKIKACEEVGIKSFEYNIDASTTQGELNSLITKLNNDDEVDGILVQFPLPKHLSEQEVTSLISPQKDVDGFSPLNLGKLVSGEDSLVACTPAGVMELFDRYGIDLAGKNAVIIGRSVIVGKPLFHLMTAKNATVTLCHSKTQNLSDITKSADIVVVAIGKPLFLKGDMIKNGAIVIDVGINRVEGKVVGDCDFDSCEPKCSYITPVPRGVGPMTITMLMSNTLKAAKMRKRLS